MGMNAKKIIDGLQFTASMILFNPLTGESKTPDQLNEDDRITYDACMGAIEVLRAREPRVMTLEEVAALPDGSIVWFEDHDKLNVMAGLLQDVLITANNYIVVMIHFATVRNKLLEVVTAMAEDYGIRWHCWTAKPTQQQRETAKW